MQPNEQPAGDDDAAKAIRCLAIEAAIFIGIPLAAAVIAALTIGLR